MVKNVLSEHVWTLFGCKWMGNSCRKVRLQKYFRIASIFNDLFYFKIVFIYTERDSAKKRKIEIATICTIWILFLKISLIWPCHKNCPFIFVQNMSKHAPKGHFLPWFYLIKKVFLFIKDPVSNLYYLTLLPCSSYFL